MLFGIRLNKNIIYFLYMKKRDTIAQLERLYLAKEKYEKLKTITLNNIKSEVNNTFTLFDGTKAHIYFHLPFFHYPEDIKKQLEKAREQHIKENSNNKGNLYIAFRKVPTDED